MEHGSIPKKMSIDLCECSYIVEIELITAALLGRNFEAETIGQCGPINPKAGIIGFFVYIVLRGH